jgi:hypothetical protein
MTPQKRVLIVGLDPELIDFSQPGYPPGMSAAKVFAGLKSCEDELTGLGYGVTMCYTDFGETAESVLRRQIEQDQFDCVMIGAGVRAVPSNFILFEKLVNVTHQYAPGAKFCFNTLPADTAAAVRRWV